MAKADRFKELNQFILSRSTFAGSGQYVQHLLDNYGSTWEDMSYAIAGAMNFNMFGIPFTGADVCGAGADTLNQTKEEQ